MDGGYFAPSSRRSQKARSPEPEMEAWWTVRQWSHKVLNHPLFECFIGAVVIFNIVTIICEADTGAACRRDPSACSQRWIEVSNAALLVIYTLEAIGRIFVYRSHLQGRGWDLFDILIVFMTYLDLIISTLLQDVEVPGIQLLRVARVAKVLRGVRLVRMFPELYMLARSFVSAISAMFWGMLLIICMLGITAILAVEFIQPLSADVFEEGSRCDEAYSSVFATLMLLVQTLMAGDSWGECSLGVIMKYPLTTPFFITSLVLIQIGTTNLIMAVVIQKARAAQESDVENRIRETSKAKKQAETRLTELCSSIDLDGGGSIGLNELLEFYASNEELRKVFDVLDIHEDELESLFSIMDKDQSGDLSYSELVSCIVKADSNDLKRQVMMLKLQIQDVWDRIRGQMQDSILTVSQGIDTLVKELVRDSQPRVSLVDMTSKLPAQRLECKRHDESSQELASEKISEVSKKQYAGYVEDERLEKRADMFKPQDLQWAIQGLAKFETDDVFADERFVALEERCKENILQMLELRKEAHAAAAKLATHMGQSIQIMLENQNACAVLSPSPKLRHAAAGKLYNAVDGSDDDTKYMSADYIEPPARHWSWSCCQTSSSAHAGS